MPKLGERLCCHYEDIIHRDDQMHYFKSSFKFGERPLLRAIKQVMFETDVSIYLASCFQCCDQNYSSKSNFKFSGHSASIRGSEVLFQIGVQL